MRGAERQRLVGPEARRDEGPGRLRDAAVSEAMREKTSEPERQSKADRPGSHRRCPRRCAARSAAHAGGHRGVEEICKASTLKGEDVRHLNLGAARLVRAAVSRAQRATHATQAAFQPRAPLRANVLLL